jgi:hypothetical protein
MKTEKTILRMNLLGGMNAYILDNVEDEELIVNNWFVVGVPDGATEEDLQTIAEDDELWVDAVQSFARCIRNS